MDRPGYNLPVDISHSSATSVPELTRLSPDEIKLLDAVIERAGPSATTFLSVFKAYNDVLSERGLDPHEVLYYGKLLKLGTMKGKNWGDKWASIKDQCSSQGSYAGSGSLVQHSDQPQTPNDGLKRVSRRVIHRISPAHQLDDTLTLHSREDESDTRSSTASDINTSISQYPFTPKAPLGQTNHIASSQSPCIILDNTRSNSLLCTSTRITTPFLQQRTRHLGEVNVSDGSGDHIPSTTPPSYRAAIQDARLSQVSHHLANSRIREQPPLVKSYARQAVAIARERKGSIVNEDDAWNKIKTQRNEIIADEFRTDRLQERCWEVWRQGFQWIIVRSYHSLESLLLL